MTENKTKPTGMSVDEYLDAIPDAARRDDCRQLMAIMAKASGERPMMWGTSIVGFGSYHYRYASGREGESCLAGFSSRKGDITVYGTAGFHDDENLLSQLGRHRLGKGCLYIPRMSAVHGDVLEELIRRSIARLKERKR